MAYYNKGEDITLAPYKRDLCNAYLCNAYIYIYKCKIRLPLEEQV